MSYRQLRKLKKTLQSTLVCENTKDSVSSNEDNVKPRKFFFARATCLSSSSSKLSEDDYAIKSLDEKWASVFSKKNIAESHAIQREYKEESDSDALNKFLLSTNQRYAKANCNAKPNIMQRHEEILKIKPYLRELLAQNLSLVNRTSASTNEIIPPIARKNRVRTLFMKRFLLLPEAKELNWPFLIPEAQRVTCVTIKHNNDQTFFNFIEAPIRTTVFTKLQHYMKRNLYETCILKLLEIHPFHMELNLLYCQMLIDQNKIEEAFTFCRRSVHALQCSFPSEFSPSFFYSNNEPPWPQVQMIDKSSSSLLLVYCILFTYSRFLMNASRYLEALQVLKLLVLLVPRQDIFLTFLYIDECFVYLRSYKRLENFCSSYFNHTITIDGKKQKENGMLYYPNLYFSDCLLQLMTLLPSINSSLPLANTVITTSSICSFQIQFTNLYNYTLFMMLRGLLLFPYFVRFLIYVLQLDINTRPTESTCNVAWKELLKCDVFKCFWKKTYQRRNHDATRRFLIETTKLSLTKFKDKWKQPKILAFIHQTVYCLVNLVNTKALRNDTIQTFRRQWCSLIPLK
ncbi:uncharacterized protein LOC128884067 isoform X2 [Hylaeus volcanicus]|uniref:uncharacterized protein LOC128884067 isoform X2 n=1 Tax=Hylaeus volcanicus TaxID=313075 RepID=UPI0023B800CA|nr:uncharacterized protein LOC128884067 isoform X2 [Hylaeus volcanicus]